MSINRRLQLLAWAQRSGSWIIEDDYDSEFSYASAPLPALKAIDDKDRVIYCGSFNKSLFQALRIGYMVVPSALVAKVANVRFATGESSGIIDQLSLVRYIEEGDFARHLRTTKTEYMRRRDELLAALRALPGAKRSLLGEHAGFHFVLWLPQGSDEKAVVERLLLRRVFVEGLGEFSREHSLPPALVIGYSSLNDERLRHAAQAIVSVPN